MAALEENPAILRKLMESGKYKVEQAVPCKEHGNPLGNAMRMSRSENFFLLLEKGANPNSKNGNDSVLQASCQNGMTDYVEALIQKGAEINVVGTWGNSPLTEAARKDQREDIMTLLLKAGADPNHKDNWGMTALLRSAERGSVASVKIMFENKANMNHQSNTGLTALIVAARAAHQAVVEYLLEQAADVTLMNEDGLTALQAAKKAQSEARKNQKDKFDQVIELLSK